MPSKRLGGFGVVVASVAVFLVVLTILALRLAGGQDPALGAGTPMAGGAASPKAKRPVVHRRIVKLRVVHHPAVEASTPSGGPAPIGSGAAAPAAAPAAPSAPSVPSGGGGSARPPPAPSSPAPAPAPAPSPPATQSS